MSKDPVAWFCKLPDGRLSIKIVGKPTEGNWEPLYTHPPCEWVGLTDEEIFEIFRCTGTSNSDINPYVLLDDARKIEAKLKEKNND
jgi:hypothetical protein